MADRDIAHARDQALRLLARREHSILELRRKLVGRGYGEEMVDPLLKQLVEEGVLSEERFAESYVRSRVGKGLGPYRIERELQEKGVPAEKIEPAMEPYADEWNGCARRVKEKKFGTERVDDFSEQARQQRFLQYRGFTHEQIRVVIDTPRND
ncbi:MAG: regulatory protein RecX [Gammaproteobacteria bacterium]|uniref:Regulatory protein RecX n=1 Tax=Candidatus Thiopontia autotrophica TaxID=2841688 RepID=A0A8J6PBD2_9GAMM|nr:regulatory protein RecX [Candidatus Thiopontia autotrophica]MBL6969621.1 regulatory protein RecX [Gammaproteobacteria bacterium]